MFFLALAYAAIGSLGWLLTGRVAGWVLSTLIIFLALYLPFLLSKWLIITFQVKIPKVLFWLIWAYVAISSFLLLLAGAFAVSVALWVLYNLFSFLILYLTFLTVKWMIITFRELTRAIKTKSE